ncbi:uncharacterized protein LOC129239441 isoform X2 [Anastrepha obliqua]|uniref:uncharacterized protein LOC129239441 isoform X2 n=1 Tax=Anastrepha obliqua TaxID=95512 RepID=UPI002409E785|nr:uncharacterized protein LOC129239441 isoform X2 [Anastrepha obliqua]
MAKAGKKGKDKRASTESEKKGKKGRKSSTLSDTSAGKGKKGKGKRKSKGKTSVIDTTTAVQAQPEVPSTPSPPPEPKCNDQQRADEPCRYTEDACCKGAIACRPNHYPGILEEPERMAVVGSESGSYESLCKLVRAGMRCADRIFIMTPWDLREGTAGLLYFDCVHALITYMLDSKKQRMSLKRIRRSVIDDICKEFCEFGPK